MREKLTEKGLLLVASSGIAMLLLIAFFIFREGLPLVAKV